MINKKIKEKKRKTQISERDKYILECIAAGYTSNDIAEDLELSISVIHADLNKMFNKTGTQNRAHLVAWAYQNKILL